MDLGKPCHDRHLPMGYVLTLESSTRPPRVPKVRSSVDRDGFVSKGLQRRELLELFQDFWKPVGEESPYLRIVKQPFHVALDTVQMERIFAELLLVQPIIALQYFHLFFHPRDF